MGFMTEMYFLNDQWDRVKKAILEDPKAFTGFIDNAMNGEAMYSDGRYIGRKDVSTNNKFPYFSVHQSHHADDTRIYLCWGNLMQEISGYGSYTLRRAIDTEETSPSRWGLAEERDADFMEEQIDKAIRELKRAKKALREPYRSLT